MDLLIEEEQSAFLKNRNISDNILISHEIMHFLRHQREGSKQYMAIKLDINKAYKCVVWNYLKQMLKVFGFHEKWVCLGLWHVWLQFPTQSIQMGIKLAFSNYQEESGSEIPSLPFCSFSVWKGYLLD